MQQRLLVRKLLLSLGINSGPLQQILSVFAKKNMGFAVEPSPSSQFRYKGKKGSPYSITERRVPELIPVLGSQPAGDVSHYFPSGLQLPSQPLRWLLPVLLLGEQRHDGCEQFA